MSIMTNPIPSIASQTSVLEAKQRLSQSLLWTLQRNFFAQQGIQAWSQRIVPQYITSNPFIARAYAKIVLSFLQEAIACENLNSTPSHTKAPFYIIELGAGSGRFAYYFLKQFLATIQHSVLKNISFKYIMTDFADRTIDYWQAHSYLQPFVNQNYLDFAHFDVEQFQEIVLKKSGEILSPETIKKPIIVLANYFFDSIPQDAFYIKEGQIHEWLITLLSPQHETNLSDPELLDRVIVDFSCQPINKNYYNDADLDGLLNDYSKRLVETVIPFPIAALQCLRYFRQLSQDRLLVLSGDRGYTCDEALEGLQKPEIRIHGSFSMMVNYHALGEYVLRQGGQTLHPQCGHSHLNISAFILGNSSNGWVETHRAYTETIEQFGPDDFFTLKEGFEKIYNSYTLPQLLAYLKLSGWDHIIFLGCFPRLLDQIGAITQLERQQLYQAIQQVWNIYYPIGEQHDLAFSLGVLLFGIQYYAEALDFFQLSINDYGLDASTLVNMSQCHYNLGQLDTALLYINQALELDQTLEMAKSMRNKIQAEIDRSMR
ncbi:tetratricopeptide repeat protein [Fortiea sp. LEGE XX443]|uniref:SAM-dependent methyltransferase n=1 Tax=Fortiea sp. LEGE XX443 TaxID=1828611 RepID=UPI001880A86D|nr:tetratricopeptide repeat protein [Fortiea sp. LEGE XX443]MBE9004755.1 tetratricopeptide repeat protein [Fortiea sp. LEGE XX443]